MSAQSIKAVFWLGRQSAGLLQSLDEMAASDKLTALSPA